MIHIEVQLLNDKIIDRQLALLSNRCRDFSPAFELMHQSFLQIEEEQFNTEGAAGGEAWAALSEIYVAWRGSAHPILQLEGKLKKSLSQAGAEGHVVEIHPFEAKFGTDLQTESGYGLGRTHQTGYTVKYPYGNRGIKPVTVPARKSISLTDKHKQEWVRLLQGWLMQSSGMYPEHFG